MWLAQSRGCRARMAVWESLLEAITQSGNFKNLWLWQPVLDKLNYILELKNWLPFNKTYLWTDLIQILSCTGIYIYIPCMYTNNSTDVHLHTWLGIFSDRRICQLLKPSDVWRLCYQTYQPSDQSKLPSWSYDQQHFCWRKAVMDSVQTKPNNSFQNSYHAEGNVKVCIRIYNEWELCRVPSISFHRLHL